MRADVVELTSRLVGIDSVNPALVAGGAGEVEIARFIVDWARTARLEADLVEATPGPSVIVRAAGSGGGRTLLLCGHVARQESRVARGRSRGYLPLGRSPSRGEARAAATSPRRLAPCLSESLEGELVGRRVVHLVWLRRDDPTPSPTNLA